MNHCGGLIREDVRHAVARPVTVDLAEERWARLQRQIEAFSATSAAIARETSLDTVLDRLAAEVRAASGLATCAVVLIDGPDERLSYVGRSGMPPDYVDRFDAARGEGAPSATLEAFRTGRTIVSPGLRDRVCSDRTARDGADFVAAPLVLHGESIGVLNGFHHPGCELHDDDVRFLTAMAHHAAIAVENARLVARLQLRAAEEERHRLARDMHDSVSQALFALSLEARGIELSAAGLSASELAGKLSELRELAQAALGDMRTLIQFRRPAELRDHGLVPGLRQLADAAGRCSSAAVEVVASESLVLDPGVEDDLFRIVQEALNNVVKHAAASSVLVRIATEPDGSVTVEVLDDGVGLDAGRGNGTGFGTATMRDRAERHRGTLRIEARADGRGTRVHVRIPGATTRTAGTETT